ncbi:MAG: hypothetical protein HLUCCX10_16565 [Algoriphagus marincola HL-49]|uniref:DUF3299 domain-containing protein n=1 Tax=Algoriphagus marincola HL-49 TaxID=1305737 RepID=A0A0N8KDQ6_9BACT|nr:MAG: hypothetical protein HLUCCX10_16565 [Algoriphagus marincola HL-49]
MKFTSSILVFWLLFSGSLETNAQSNSEQNLWSLFQQVPFKEKLNRDFGMYFFYPEFTEELKVLKGKEVVLKGFYIPLELYSSQMLVLSKYPMAECFFCGAAGPESVAVVYLQSIPPRMKVDQIVGVRGILDLNESDVEEMTFIIRDAKLIN